MRTLIYLLIIASLSSCNETETSPENSIEQEIIALNSDELHRSYLENLMGRDQSLRQGQMGETMSKYGKDSKEYGNFIKEFNRTDSINQLKIDIYLANYGYPKKEKLDGIACLAPWVIIHHSSSVEFRRKHFKILYKAYLEQDIDPTAFSMYLGRTYRLQFGERMGIEEIESIEEEINVLIDALEFE